MVFARACPEATMLVVVSSKVAIPIASLTSKCGSSISSFRASDSFAYVSFVSLDG